MTDNPFRSPSLPAEPPPKEQQQEPGECPVGISILFALHLVGGAGLLGAKFLLFGTFHSLPEPQSPEVIPQISVLVGIIILGILALTSGIGMWVGAKWGWWLGTFFYMYAVFRNASALGTIVIADQLEGSHVIKYGVRIVISLLLFLHFFKSNVQAYFGLQNLNKAMAAGIIVGVCIALTAILSGLSMVLN